MRQIIAAASAALALACAGSASAATVVDSQTGVFTSGFALGKLGYGSPFTGQRFKVEFKTDALVDTINTYLEEVHKIREYDPATGEDLMWGDYDDSIGVMHQYFPSPGSGNFTVYFNASEKPPGPRTLPNGNIYWHGYYGVFVFDVVLPDGAASGAAYTAVISSIPEPATWAMMITGFGLAGASLRRSTQSRAQLQSS